MILVRASTMRRTSPRSEGRGHHGPWQLARGARLDDAPEHGAVARGEVVGDGGGRARRSSAAPPRSPGAAARRTAAKSRRAIAGGRAVEDVGEREAVEAARRGRPRGSRRRRPPRAPRRGRAPSLGPAELAQEQRARVRVGAVGVGAEARAPCARASPARNAAAGSGGRARRRPRARPVIESPTSKPARKSPVSRRSPEERALLRGIVEGEEVVERPAAPAGERQELAQRAHHPLRGADLHGRALRAAAARRRAGRG